jgi:hypothetical protein
MDLPPLKKAHFLLLTPSQMLNDGAIRPSPPLNLHRLPPWPSASKHRDKRIINGQTDVNQLVPSSTSGAGIPCDLCKSLDAARGQHDAMERPQRADRDDRLVKRNLGFLSLLTRWQQTTSCWVLTGTSQHRNADSSCSAKHLKKQSRTRLSIHPAESLGLDGGQEKFFNAYNEVQSIRTKTNS